MIDPCDFDPRTVCRDERCRRPGGCPARAKRPGDEIEGPRSGPHQRRGFADRVASLSHLWTARRCCHGRPGALPTGLTALTPAHGFPGMDFCPWVSERTANQGRSQILFLSSSGQEREISCPEPARGRRACGWWREAGELSRRTRRDHCSAQVTGRATIHRQHGISRRPAAAPDAIRQGQYPRSHQCTESPRRLHRQRRASTPARRDRTASLAPGASAHGPSETSPGLTGVARPALRALRPARTSPRTAQHSPLTPFTPLGGSS